MWLKSYLLLQSLLILSLVVACRPESHQEANQLEPHLRLETEAGDILIHLYEDTPVHRKNFLKLAREDFFDGQFFHRIVPGFVIQAGDPSTKPAAETRESGPGYTLEPEFSEHHLHTVGAVAAARPARVAWRADRAGARGDRLGRCGGSVDGRQILRTEFRTRHCGGMVWSHGSRRLMRNPCR